MKLLVLVLALTIKTCNAADSPYVKSSLSVRGKITESNVSRTGSVSCHDVDLTKLLQSDSQKIPDFKSLFAKLDYAALTEKTLLDPQQETHSFTLSSQTDDEAPNRNFRVESFFADK